MMSSFSQHAQRVQTAYSCTTASKLLQQSIEDEIFTGRFATLRGQKLLNFGNASYLGLSTDERLKIGAINAIVRYGVQFSSSRSYLRLPIYDELESLLRQIFNGWPCLVAPSTSLAHLGVMPVVFLPEDAIILDQKAHASLQVMSMASKATGTHLEMIGHNDMNQLEDRVRELSSKFRRVWFVTDGVFSMFGDFAPFDAMATLQKKWPALHFYVDDAHGMSWTGRSGQGPVLEKLQMSERLILVTSLNKAFAGGGGCIVVHDELTREMILRAGPSLVFSGPVQPAGLGAAVESAKIHLSPEIYERQRKLKRTIKQFLVGAWNLGLPIASDELTPIFYLQLSTLTALDKMLLRMQDDGFWANLAGFPAVPLKQSGVRMSFTWHHEKKDVDQLLASISRHLPQVLAEENLTVEDVRAAFAPKRAEEAATKKAGSLAST